MHRFCLTALVVLCASGAINVSTAQENAREAASDTSATARMEGTLPPIAIESARVSTVTSTDAPLSVSVLNRSEARRLLEPGLSLEEVLGELPGLWVNDRGGNASIGERISIRGMGWRAAFGVRGVQVILDGIPLTMPDGQAFADIVSPSMIQKAELIRGPSSLFWGNGSGGVLYLSTRPATSTNAIRIRTFGGSHDASSDIEAVQHLSLESNARIGSGQYNVFISNDQRDGYRDYSAFRFTRAAVYGTIPLKNQSIFQFTGALADQDAENTGQLTAEQVQENPRMANARNVNTLAGKESFQAQLGGTLLSNTNIGQLTVTAYGIVRDLDNPLSFTYIDLNRLAGGIRTNIQQRSSRMEWGVGVDIGVQSDDRRNVNNDAGNPGAEVSLAQDETVQAYATYGFLRVQIAGPLHATAGLRGDLVRFSMSDRLLENGDQSGDRNFSALSPALGLSYVHDNMVVYTNYRNAFETPTTTELVNRPDLDGGFNPDVDPQRVDGFEIGVRGQTRLWRFTYDVALYTMDVRDRLTPFQTEAGGDRTFYRNQGKNTHRGVELALSFAPTPWLSSQITHTSNRFEYEDGDLEGNRLPGIPDHRTLAFLRLSSPMVWVQTTYRTASSYYVNDANTEKNDAYSAFDINIGLTRLAIDKVTLSPFFKITNVFDEQYNGSVIINAFGGRYYEPAPGRTFQFGLNLTL